MEVGNLNYKSGTNISVSRPLFCTMIKSDKNSVGTVRKEGWLTTTPSTRLPYLIGVNGWRVVERQN